MSRAERTQRTALLLGQEGVDRLSRAFVAVFGVGGVGSFAAEALARAGVGRILLVDSDTVSESNINRQLVALTSTVGQPKVEVMARRIRDIQPEAEVICRQEFFSEENAERFPFHALDYVIDAIDSVSAKVELICRCKAAGTPIISCMGAGNKLDASALEVADIYDTSVCPLARVMRAELRKRGVKHLKVVYSKEPALTPIDDTTISCRTHCICPPDTARKCTQRRQVPGSNAFVPAAAGLIIAGEVVRDIANGEPQKK